MTALAQVRLHAAIQPGTTILVTQAPVLAHTTGTELTVLASTAAK